MPYADPKRRKEYEARYREQNRERLRETGMAWYWRNKHKAAKTNRTSRLKSKYGITPETWNAVFEAQGRACAICRGKETRHWHTDHCHVSNKFRGILCSNCNAGIGLLKDNQFVLRAAADYVERHK